MERKPANDDLGFEIPAAERTATVEQLLRVIVELREENRRLREEIERLKGLPARPQRKPSMLGQDEPPEGDKPKKPKQMKRKGKRPGSTKR